MEQAKILSRKKNDYESLHSDILYSDQIKKLEKDLLALCQQYDSVLSSILSKYAPVSTETLPRNSPTPWMTHPIMKVKTFRHNLERTWRRSQYHLCTTMMTIS